MGEKQEKVWVVMRYVIAEHNFGGCRDNWPVKVFDDRKDARAYVAQMGRRAKKYAYLISGAKRA